MRVVHVSTDPGIPVFGTKGASVHVRAVLSELVRAGHEVHLATPRPGGEACDELREVRVHHLPAVGGGDPAERERSAWASDAAVADLLDDVRPDVVYERYALWGRSATRWARGRGVPSVLEVNAPLLREQAEHRVLVDHDGAGEATRSALSAATAVVCVSEPVAEWVRSVRPHEVHVEPNGVDVERLRPRDPGVRGVGPFTIGFVGTLRPWHGTAALVDALALLARGPDADAYRLLVVGDGPDLVPLRERARAAGVDHLVETTGAVAHADVPTLLHRMDVATAPYPPGAQYFSPLKIYEYLAAGVPVVASDVGQVPQALDHGRAGVLVAPGDPGAIAGAVRALRDDPARGRRYAARGRSLAESRSWAGVVRRSLAHAGVAV